MQAVIQFILDYKDYIVGGLVLIAGIIMMGRRKSVVFIKDFLEKEKDNLVEHMEKDPAHCAKIVYALLPAKVKVFVNVKTIEKLISKLADILDK
jgi:hypothetical protein